MKEAARINAKQVTALHDFGLGLISEHKFKAITRKLNIRRKRLGLALKPICGMEGLSIVNIGGNQIVGFTTVLKKFLSEMEVKEYE